MREKEKGGFEAPPPFTPAPLPFKISAEPFYPLPVLQWKESPEPREVGKRALLHSDLFGIAPNPRKSKGEGKREKGGKKRGKRP